MFLLYSAFATANSTNVILIVSDDQGYADVSYNPSTMIT